MDSEYSVWARVDGDVALWTAKKLALAAGSIVIDMSKQP
jgi:hypothetical protein